MTLQEAKDQIAREYGYKDWWSIDFRNVSEEAARDEAAELYAKSKMREIAEKAWEAGREYGEQWEMKESDEYRVITVPNKETWLKENNLV